MINAEGKVVHSNSSFRIPDEEVIENLLSSAGL